MTYNELVAAVAERAGYLAMKRTLELRFMHPAAVGDSQREILQATAGMTKAELIGAIVLHEFEVEDDFNLNSKEL